MGGLLTGIASAVKASRPEARVYSAEAATGASAADALAGGPGEVEYTRSWVDGAGSRSIIPAVWEHVSGLIDGAAVVSLAEAGKAGSGKVVAIVSGGNIDPAVFSRILAGESS